MFTASRPGNRHVRRGRVSRFRPRLEELEARVQPSASALDGAFAVPLFSAGAAVTNTTVPAGAFQPAQVRHAYGIDQLSGDGSGQTIAIVDAYHDANIAADVDHFDQQFASTLTAGSQSLYDAYGAASSFLSVVNQTGGTTYPSADGSGGWQLETALDVQWAHVVAPKANILLVEASSSSFGNLFTAVNYAAQHASTVSMSWGAYEFSGEASWDTYFSSYPNVTFVGAAGDAGGRVIYPAASPYVVAVGGTNLKVDSSSAWSSESAWSAGGGGVSRYESQPAYQVGVVPTSVTTTKRSTPDVAYDGDPNTGFAIYSSATYYPYYPFSFGRQSGWFQIGGTSAGAPQWAGLVALADQARTSDQGALGSSGTLAAIYQNSPTTLGAQTDFHDVTSGSNGFSAVTGYDRATGVGSPKADQIVPALTAASATSTVAKAAAAAGTNGGTAKTKVTVVLVSPTAPLPVFSAPILVAAQSPAALLVPAGAGAPMAPLPLPGQPAPPSAVALTLPAVVTTSQFGVSPAGRAAEGAAADPKGLSSGEMPAPAAPELTPGQDGRPSKRSEDAPPSASAPGEVAAPVGDADTFFADEGAVALLAGRDSLAVLAGEGEVTHVVGGSGFAVVGLAAMLGRCWLESEADSAADRRRAQGRFLLQN